MNNESTDPPSATPSISPGKVYHEFELSPRMFSEVQVLARRDGCTPFEMCVRLTREGLAQRNSRRVG